MSLRRRLLTGVVASLVAATAVACGGNDDTDVFDVADAAAESEVDLAYVIPEGAGEALDRGEPLEILPAELTLETGETIEIVNNDGRGHLIGPFFVGAGETLRQTFTAPGEYIGECTVHPSGQIVVTVV